ncbi:hypothetical protein Y71_23395 [Kosakonia radicincitans DSM 16656]|nr:hypothetical protein Y71_23395 [Kosakonia radicincitans DSM 16656]
MNNVAKNNVGKSTYYYAVIVVMMIPQSYLFSDAIAWRKPINEFSLSEGYFGVADSVLLIIVSHCP